MAFARGLRLGAGLVGLGYGVYRLSRGKRDWVTTTALTSGLSVALSGMAKRRNRTIVAQMGRMAMGMGRGIPQVRRRVMKMAPQLLANVTAAAMNAMR